MDKAQQLRVLPVMEGRGRRQSLPSAPIQKRSFEKIHIQLIRMILAYPLPATFYSDPWLCKACAYRSLWLAVLNTKLLLALAFREQVPPGMSISAALRPLRGFP